jgi:acetyl-CoA acyltransferase
MDEKRDEKRELPRGVVIAGYVRSPFTPAMKGELKDVRPDDLVAQTIQGLIKETGIDPKLIEDLKLGCATPEGEQGWNMARNVIFLAGLPKTMGGVTTNRFCGSSMQTVHDAVGMISAGMAEAVICAGVESMSRVPMGGYNIMPNPKLKKDYPQAYISTGGAAENTAEKFQVSREAQDAFALGSQQKAAKADFSAEIVPITTPSGKQVTKDGCPRPGTTLEALAKLKPAFKQAGSVTAGTSSPLTDGAAALLVCSEEFAKEHGLPILAKVKSYAVSGVEAETLMGPVTALKKALKKAGLGIDDLDVIELHEAFAAQAVACTDQLGLDPAKVNKDGGAIAMGHPLGASGAVRLGTAARILNREGGKYAAAAMCIAGGQGIATILEAPANDNTPQAAKQPKPKQQNPKP